MEPNVYVKPCKMNESHNLLSCSHKIKSYFPANKDKDTFIGPLDMIAATVCCWDILDN